MPNIRPIRILGIDPGLAHTGWGVIEVQGNHISHLANGTISTDSKKDLSERLREIYEGLEGVMVLWRPEQAAVEETFVNQNPASALKLGKARGIALLVPAKAYIPVGEYAPNLVKKSVVGSGHADKKQIQMMVKTLLPGCQLSSEHSADALAVAICHAHHGVANNSIAAQIAEAAK